MIQWIKSFILGEPVAVASIVTVVVGAIIAFIPSVDPAAKTGIILVAIAMITTWARQKVTPMATMPDSS